MPLDGVTRKTLLPGKGPGSFPCPRRGAGVGGARPPCKCKTADAGQYTNNQIEKSRSPALLDDNHKVTNRGGIHQLQKSKREFDFFLSCALSGYEAIIRWKTVFFHCFFVPEALFLEKENSTPWILFVLNGIYSYKVEFTFTSDQRCFLYRKANDFLKK